MTKDEIISHKDFGLLQEYLDSMYPDRYEFQKDELIIYYPKVTIKNTSNETYDIYNIFIHYGYHTYKFSFTKLHHTLSDYMNQIHYLFTHPHVARNQIPYRTSNYCYGRLPIEYNFTDIQSVIAAINVTDFWLHNENSSDCYIHISNMYYNKGNDSLTSLVFYEDIKDELESDMIKDVNTKRTIFGDIIDIEWNDENIKEAMVKTVKNKMLFCTSDLQRVLDKYSQHTIRFKDEDYYITIDSFDGKHIINNTKSNINENVVQQFKDMATGVYKSSQFLSKLEKYYFEY